MSVDHEPAGARRHRRQVDRGGPGLAEHHVAAPGAAASGRIAFRRSDDQVGEAVAVDIAGARHAVTAVVERTLAIDDEAAGACRNRRQVDRRGSGLAEHDVASARGGAAGWVTLGRPDNEVGEPVAVDIAGTRHAEAAGIAQALAVDHEPAGPRRHCRQVDPRCRCRYGSVD